MFRTLFITLVLCTGLLSCGSLGNLGNLPGNTTITETEAAQGIREALDHGVASGIGNLNKVDGFFGNQAYKLFLPAEAQRIENTLRNLGMDGMVDRAILQINRSAEDAVGYARPIFLDAIREMTITDALNIIRGPKDAATQYFKEKTTAKLVKAFTPVINSSLEKFSATKYYDEIVRTYNQFPTTINKLNPDLTAYVVEKAVGALFDQIAQEEARIRENPAARTSEILKKVFGWAGRQRNEPVRF